MGLTDRLHRSQQAKQVRGGYSVTDWVPNRINQNGQLEMHLPMGNYIGPRTDIKRRLREGVKPTTHTDAGARLHDIQYHNIGARLAKGQITRAQAAAQIRASDNQLMKTALKNKISINPLEHAHANAALMGIAAKKGLQSVGVMDELAFTGRDDEELEGGKKKKKKDPVGGLRRRLKKLGL